jgi:hypothetical protein
LGAVPNKRIFTECFLYLFPNYIFFYFLFFIIYLFFYGGVDETCGAVPPVRVSRSAMQAQYVAQVAHGIILFLLFGSGREIYSSWKSVFIRFYLQVKIWWRNLRQTRANTEKEAIPMRMPSPALSISQNEQFA